MWRQASYFVDAYDALRNRRKDLFITARRYATLLTPQTFRRMREPRILTNAARKMVGCCNGVWAEDPGNNPGCYEGRRRDPFCTLNAKHRTSSLIKRILEAGLQPWSTGEFAASICDFGRYLKCTVGRGKIMIRTSANTYTAGLRFGEMPEKF